MTAMSPGSRSHTELIVVRHGQSRGNVEGRFGGHGPTPLTPHGRLQAAAAGRRLAAQLAPEVLVSSDLPRALETARAIAEATGLELATDPGLRERSVGDWDDQLFSDIAERYPDEWRRMTERERYDPPGAEPIDAVFTRVGATVDRLVEAHPGQRVAVVSHGIAIFHMFAHICGLGSPAGDLPVFALVDNASVSRFRCYPGGRWRIVSLNDVAHLADVVDPDATTE